MLRLKNVRNFNDMSVEEAASAIGVSVETLSAWEKDEASPSKGELKKILEIYNCSLDYLLGFSDEPFMQPVAEKDSPRKFRDDPEKFQRSIETIGKRSLMHNEFMNKHFLDSEETQEIEKAPSTRDEALLEYFGQLNEQGQTKVIDYARDLANGGNYSKNSADKLA